MMNDYLFIAKRLLALCQAIAKTADLLSETTYFSFFSFSKLHKLDGDGLIERA